MCCSYGKQYWMHLPYDFFEFYKTFLMWSIWCKLKIQTCKVSFIKLSPDIKKLNITRYFTLLHFCDHHIIYDWSNETWNHVSVRVYIGKLNKIDQHLYQTQIFDNPMYILIYEQNIDWGFWKTIVCNVFQLTTSLWII